MSDAASQSPVLFAISGTVKDSAGQLNCTTLKDYSFLLDGNSAATAGASAGVML